MRTVRSDACSELLAENKILKTEIVNLNKRLEKMQKIFERHHAEIRELKLKAGATRVGCHRN